MSAAACVAKSVFGIQVINAAVSLKPQKGPIFRVKPKPRRKGYVVELREKQNLKTKTKLPCYHGIFQYLTAC